MILYNSNDNSNPAMDRAVESDSPESVYAPEHNQSEPPAQHDCAAHGHEPPCEGVSARPGGEIYGVSPNSGLISLGLALLVQRQRLIEAMGLPSHVLSSDSPSEMERRRKELEATPAERNADLVRRYYQKPNENPDDPKLATFRAADGTRRRPGSDPLNGLRQVAAAEVLGISRTHAMVKLGKGLVVVTLIQPPKRDADTVRSQVMQYILTCSLEEDFQRRCRQKRARKQEIALARRVMALWHVGDRSDEDREIRRLVGFQIVEIRSC